MSIVWCLFLAGCQESLPLREDPNIYFSTSLSLEYDVFYPNNPAASRNQVILFLSVASTYDDVIQEYLDISGTAQITWVLGPHENIYGVDPTRTFTITKANLLRAKGYDPMTGIITIVPGDTVVLACTWNFVTNDSSNLMDLFQKFTDVRCVVMDTPSSTSFRKVTARQQFTSKASVRLTTRTSTFSFDEVTYSSCFVVPYYSPYPQLDGHSCFNESTTDPCTLIR